MGRLAAIVGALIGILLVPLALAGGTAWLLIPAHLLFSCLVCVAAMGSGLAGRPGRARAWGLGFLVASIAMVGALELGSTVRGSGYWVLPWAVVLLWAWVPPVVAGIGGFVGDHRKLALSRGAVRRRKAG